MRMQLKLGLDLGVIRIRVLRSRGEAQQRQWFVVGRTCAGGQLFRSLKMKMRLLSLAAAATLLIVATPGPEARAAAAKLPVLKSEASDIVEVRHRKKLRRKFYKRRYHRRGYYYPRRYHRRYHRRWRGPRFAIYVGSPRCSWLRRRAILTGSRYWWRRYYRCRYWW